MSTWIALTAADVVAALAAAEASAFREQQLEDGAGDPLPGIVATVAAEIRDAARKSTAPPADESLVPAGMHHHAVAIARFHLLSRLPVEIGEDRKAAFDAANAAIGALARGERSVAADEDAPAHTASGGQTAIDIFPA